MHGKADGPGLGCTIVKRVVDGLWQGEQCLLLTTPTLPCLCLFMTAMLTRPSQPWCRDQGLRPWTPSLPGFRPRDGGSCAWLPVVWPPPLQARHTRQGSKSKRAKRYWAVLSRRKPRPPLRPPGAMRPRHADRQAPALQLPPRATRSEPDAGPCGSVTGSAVYLPYQSCTHSQTLPYMSYNPQAFGCSLPTG